MFNWQYINLLSTSGCAFVRRRHTHTIVAFVRSWSWYTLPLFIYIRLRLRRRHCPPPPSPSAPQSNQSNFLARRKRIDDCLHATPFAIGNHSMDSCTETYDWHANDFIVYGRIGGVESFSDLWAKLTTAILYISSSPTRVVAWFAIFDVKLQTFDSVELYCDNWLMYFRQHRHHHRCDYIPFFCCRSFLFSVANRWFDFLLNKKLKCTKWRLPGAEQNPILCLFCARITRMTWKVITETINSLSSYSRRTLHRLLDKTI